MSKKIKGKVFIKIGAYWLPEKEADNIGIKKLFRSNKHMIPIKGPIKNGEIVLEDAYYDVENKKILMEVKCDYVDK